MLPFNRAASASNLLQVTYVCVCVCLCASMHTAGSFCIFKYLGLCMHTVHVCAGVCGHLCWGGVVSFRPPHPPLKNPFATFQHKFK